MWDTAPRKGQQNDRRWGQVSGDWIDEFPQVTESSPEFMAAIVRAWGPELDD
jgi:hypothetical protein